MQVYFLPVVTLPWILQKKHNYAHQKGESLNSFTIVLEADAEYSSCRELNESSSQFQLK